MFSQDDQVLDIDDAISPRHRANIIEWLVCVLVVNHHAHIYTIHNSVAVKVNDESDLGHIPLPSQELS